MTEMISCPLEVKWASADGVAGEIEGYGSVFGNKDSHGDVILPGAFAQPLAQHKAAGTMPALYVMHGPALGGSAIPDGVWTHMEEDEKGLKVCGRISALDTDHGKRIRSLVQDGALKGLSIGFMLGDPANAIRGKTAAEPKRQIKTIGHLVEVSLVTTPSNARAMVDSVKAVLGLADKDRASAELKRAIGLHVSSLSGGDSMTVDERKQLLECLQNAHEAVTGQRMDVRLAPATIRELETALREIGFSRSQATEIATRGLKAAPSRDETVERASISADLLGDLKSLAASFTST